MQSLLSENWHSVRWLKPKLRDGVKVFHRVFRGKAAVLLFDPSSHRFHRLSVEAWQVLELFDGLRTLEDIWEQAALTQTDEPRNEVLAPDSATSQASTRDAIGQQELVQLVSQLYGVDLLQSQVTPDATEVLERYERQRKAKLKQIFMNPLSIKLPLLFPEPWLKTQTPIAERLFSLPMFWCWLILVVPAMFLAGMHWGELTENISDRVLNAQNLMIAWFTYPIVKALHEWSHALAVKKWGGQVREAGIMFLVFTPVPYVDATDSYGFSSKWQRATVAAAGVMAELVLGALALYVWVLAEPGLLRAVAYNVVLIAGVSTLLVNGNPLMRYDSYFVLSEWLEIPNFAQRSTKYWSYLVDRYLFSAKDATSPAQSSGERRVLFFYGAIAPIYRLGISLGLAWFVAEEYFIFGVLIAIAGVWSSLVMPVWKGWKHLHSSPSLVGRYDSAVKRTLVGLTIVVLVFGIVPVPFYAVSEAVVWVPDETVVRARAAGLVDVSMVSSGQLLKKGDLIGVLENSALEAEREATLGQMDELDARLRKEETEDIVKAVATRRQLEAAREKYQDAERKTTDLNLFAGANGRWVFVNGSEPAGQYFKRGQIIGYVIDGPTKILRAAVAQEDVNLVQARTKSVSVRLFRRPFVAYDAKNVRPVASGQQQLVSPALGSEGGGVIPVDPSQQEGTTALQRVFDCEIELEQADPLAVFGDRAQVRFDLGWAPLAQQLFLRLRQAFLARLNV
jgi:putative peptide zinc metalloprotease protein